MGGVKLMRLHPAAEGPGIAELALEAFSRIAAAIIYRCMAVMAGRWRR